MEVVERGKRGHVSTIQTGGRGEEEEKKQIFSERRVFGYIREEGAS